MTVMHRLAACILLVALTPGASLAQRAPAPPDPVFVETFAYDPAVPAPLLDKWIISSGLDRSVRDLRVGIVADSIGRTVGRISVHEGDARDGAAEAALLAQPYVCDSRGSRAAEIEAGPVGFPPTERAEIQIKSERATGAGALVKFGEPVWYRFSFKIAGDWPIDVPAAGRTPCRTVIQQIKQDSSKDGQSCRAGPFLKIEARPLGERVLFFAQLASGAPCAVPPAVRRTKICVVDDLARETWATVNVRLFPAQDASGRADLWLNGRHCGSYRGPMGDRTHGERRNGVPVVNAQPRFGIYRDWRAETQTIYFDRIMFWNADPAGHADWGVGLPPQ
jgi:hypothetical protein